MGDSGVRNPLEPTPARLARLNAVARGEVEVKRVDVDKRGKPGWLPCCGTRMTDWLTDPLVYLRLWETRIDIAPTGERYLAYLTSEGRELLEKWSEIPGLKKGMR